MISVEGPGYNMIDDNFFIQELGRRVLGKRRVRKLLIKDHEKHATI